MVLGCQAICTRAAPLPFAALRALPWRARCMTPWRLRRCEWPQ
jgi:hypothetical protein